MRMQSHVRNGKQSFVSEHICEVVGEFVSVTKKFPVYKTVHKGEEIVLEYAEDRADIVREFARILKSDGKISIVKHNRAGRVMQMVVLLNNFEHTHSLLDGNDGMTSKYGAIRYYEDSDIEKWCRELTITKTFGMRTLWDMQQNQEIHKDPDWQDKMVEIEMRVSDLDRYKDVAFFHHLMIEKR